MCDVLDPAQGVLQGPMTIYQAGPSQDAWLVWAKATDAPVLDLSGVDEIDTAGVQMLAMARRELAQRGMALTLVQPSQPVREVLDALRLSAWLSAADASA